MTDFDRARFGKIVAALAVATRSEADTPTMELYFRALRDIPMDLVAQAAEELTATAKFFPKPVEWRLAVDELLDRRQRVKEIAGPSNQPRLPGEIGEYHCEACDNTGWTSTDEPCDRGERCGRYRNGEHTHPIARRCMNKFCVEARAQAAERKRRYAR